MLAFILICYVAAWCIGGTILLAIAALYSMVRWWWLWLLVLIFILLLGH